MSVHRRCEDDDDLYPCAESWAVWRSQSHRYTVRVSGYFIRVRIKRQYKIIGLREPLDIQAVTTKIMCVLPVSYTANVAVFGFLYGPIYTMLGNKQPKKRRYQNELASHLFKGFTVIYFSSQQEHGNNICKYSNESIWSNRT